ncbi:MAG TPA: hypothetical protein VD994_18060 [Prosthecobacter sp.]|nr:hypothetical protein [Prosthecobacter sp.]
MSKALVGMFEISKTTVESLREELSAVRAERDALKTQSMTDRIMNDWLRSRVNALEAENKALIERAYDIRLPVPELIRTNPKADEILKPIDIFGDIGEDLARAMGHPSYDTNA